MSIHLANLMKKYFIGKFSNFKTNIFTLFNWEVLKKISQKIPKRHKVTEETQMKVRLNKTNENY